MLFLQVINAALALAARPKSQVVKSHMEMYKNTWENHIRVLTEAVDDITSIDDFLAVSGALLLISSFPFEKLFFFLMII